MRMAYNLPTVRINPSKDDAQQAIDDALQAVEGTISERMRQILYLGAQQVLGQGSKKESTVEPVKESAPNKKAVKLGGGNIVDDLLGDFDL